MRLLVGQFCRIEDAGSRKREVPTTGHVLVGHPPLFAALAPARGVLIAGAGGGFDVYAGLPLVLALWHGGARVHLANLSFSELELLDRDGWEAENVAAVGPEAASPDWYFPERALARWLADHDLPSTVYAFPPLGVNGYGPPTST